MEQYGNQVGIGMGSCFKLPNGSKNEQILVQDEQKVLQGEQKKVPMSIMSCREQNNGAGGSNILLELYIKCVLILLLQTEMSKNAAGTFISFRYPEFYLVLSCHR